MNNKILLGIAGLLFIACAGEGYYIHKLKKNQQATTPQDVWIDQNKWMSEVRKIFLMGNTVPFKDFDDLFNDKFFDRKFDPFAEIDRFHNKLNPFFNNSEKSLFGKSWDDWFQNRMDVADINPETNITDKEVILSIKIPGLKGESLNVNVNDNRIRIAYDAKSVQSKKDDKSGIDFSSQSIQHFEKIMPIPGEADPTKSRIVQDGDTVKIIFEKRQK